MGRSVEAAFAEQAARTPDAIAIAPTLTYAEFDRRAEEMAAALRGRGVLPGDCVAVNLGRGVDLVVALVAVLKTGAAYVPLDPDAPAKRREFVIADTRARVVVDARWFGDARAARADARRAVVPSNAAVVPPTAPAYVIHTSGSTGTPKGVVVPHRAILRLVRDTDYIQITPEDRVAQASVCTFDAATFEIWGALLNGATLVHVPKDVLLDADALAAALRRDRISVLFVTTALFNQLVRRRPDVFATLRVLLFGGEAVDPNTVRMVVQHGKPEHLLHVYGPTENTTFSTWHEVTRVDDDARTVPIGKAIANTTAHVIDGELLLGGDGLALGYLNDEALTAQRFVTLDGLGRVYKTGDRVRENADGALEFLGRFDDQVKIRGHRIEPGEVEAALRDAPGVREAAVVAREDAPGDKKLVAYVVATGTTDATALRAFLAERLPAWMLPAAIVPMDALPLNANGKVDKRALPEPPAAGEQPRDGDVVLPRDATEARLAAIWRELLRCAPPSIHDDFFALGGHSLLAVQVSSRIRDAFGVELPLTALFEATTIEGLAQRVEALRRKASSSGGPAHEEIDL